MFDKIGTDFGHIDIIVNNAGVSGPVKIFTNSSYQEFKDCVSIHLTGTFWTSIKAIEVLNHTWQDNYNLHFFHRGEQI